MVYFSVSTSYLQHSESSPSSVCANTLLSVYVDITSYDTKHMLTKIMDEA